MADRRTPKRKSIAEPEKSGAKKRRGSSSVVANTTSTSTHELHDDATQTANTFGEVHWEWENEEEIITQTVITEDRVIDLRSKTILTPIQRSVLAVNHIFTHGRHLHDGDINRLVNTDRDEVVSVESDEESEISTPARRLYASRTGLSSVKKNTASNARSRASRGRVENETTSESALLASEDQNSVSSRSSRKSSAGTRGPAVVATSSSSSNTMSLAVPKSTTSSRRTSGAATTAALTAASKVPSTPTNSITATRTRRGASRAASAYDPSSALSTPVSTPAASRQVSPVVDPVVVPVSRARAAARAPVAPAVAAFNADNADYVPPDDYTGGDDDFFIPPVEEEQVAQEEEVAGGVQQSKVNAEVIVQRPANNRWTRPFLRVLALVLVFLVLFFWFSASPKKHPLQASPIVVVESFAPSMLADQPPITISAAASADIQRLREEAARQDEAMAEVLDYIASMNETLDVVLLYGEQQVAGANADAQETLHRLQAETASLAQHITMLKAATVQNAEELVHNITLLELSEQEEKDKLGGVMDSLETQLLALAEEQTQLQSHVADSLSTLTSVVGELRGNNSAESVVSASEHSEESVGDSVESLRRSVARLQEQRADRERAFSQANDSLSEVERSVQRMSHHVDTAYHNTETLTRVNQERAALAEAALRRQEAERDAAYIAHHTHASLIAEPHGTDDYQDEYESTDANESIYHPLPAAEAEAFVHSASQSALKEAIDTERSDRVKQVDSELTLQVKYAAKTQHVEIGRTLNSPVVKHAVNTHNDANRLLHDALKASEDAAAAQSERERERESVERENVHDYASGPRGGRIVNPRVLTLNRGTSHALTTKPYKNSASSAMKSFFSHFPGLSDKTVVSHIRPSSADYYALPANTHHDGKDDVLNSDAQITLQLPGLVEVRRIVLIHAVDNSSNSGSGDNSGDSGDNSGDSLSSEDSVQPCAPNRVRFVGWTADPTGKKANSVDLGTYVSLFSAYQGSDYRNNANATSVLLEQSYDVVEHMSSINKDLPALAAVTLQVLSNHGEEKYTCVHRIQVLGVLKR